MTRISTELRIRTAVSSHTVVEKVMVVEREEVVYIHVWVAHPALEDILEAGHTLQGFAGDIKHKRELFPLTTAIRLRRRIEMYIGKEMI